MHALSTGMALLLALAIIAIGALYVVNPRSATRGFGLPLPEDGANVVWWLRLKGVRDIASGAIVLAFIACGTQQGIGMILLMGAITPIGDMLTSFAAKGSTKSALGVHASTAVMMVLTSLPMLAGAR